MGDRIAIVVSIGWLILSLIFNDGESWAFVLFLMIPVFLYWGYRFIKGR